MQTGVEICCVVRLQVEQAPGSLFWIALVEVRQEGSVREVLQAGAVVCHEVHRFLEVEADATVGVLALMSAHKKLQS